MNTEKDCEDVGSGIMWTGNNMKIQVQIVILHELK